MKLLRWLLAVLFDAATRQCECAGKKNRSGTSEDKKASKVISCTIKKKRTAKRRRNGRGERLHDFTTINATTILRAVGARGAGGTVLGKAKLPLEGIYFALNFLPWEFLLINKLEKDYQVYNF